MGHLSPIICSMLNPCRHKRLKWSIDMFCSSYGQYVLQCVVMIIWTILTCLNPSYKQVKNMRILDLTVLLSLVVSLFLCQHLIKRQIITRLLYIMCFTLYQAFQNLPRLLKIHYNFNFFFANPKPNFFQVLALVSWKLVFCIIGI